VKPTKGTVNHVELIGWLGNDPEQRYTPAGVAVAEFSIATKRPGSRDENGERTFETDWIDVVAWDQQANFAAEFLHKGSRVRATGSLQVDKWEDRDGNKRKRVFVRADDLMPLDARQSQEEAAF
jgi:single-strand DNA-binding protein